MKCTVCHGEMKPLATSYYCPKDCDRIPAHVANEITKPNCAHLNVAPFNTVGIAGDALHCWDCGLVFQDGTDFI